MNVIEIILLAGALTIVTMLGLAVLGGHISGRMFKKDYEYIEWQSRQSRR